MIEIVIYVGLLLLCAPPLGRWMARLFQREEHLRIERWLYRLIGVDPAQEMNWKQYAVALLYFNFVGFAAHFAMLLAQKLSLHLAFNTAVSFMTNTNWQSYSGESTLSYLTQMAGLAVHNFLSAATLTLFSRGQPAF